MNAVFSKVRCCKLQLIAPEGSDQYHAQDYTSLHQEVLLH